MDYLWLAHGIIVSTCSELFHIFSGLFHDLFTNCSGLFTIFMTHPKLLASLSLALLSTSLSCPILSTNIICLLLLEYLCSIIIIFRIAINVLTHPLFSFAIICTILVNCQVMIKPESEYTSSTEVVFTAIYTYESAIKLLSRGFALEGFTYLRDPWNWLDFSVIAMSYVTIAIDLGAFSALRTFRVFRALKSVAVIPGLKTIVSAIVYAVKNLKDVIILTTFILAIFALLGLQVYMGGLSQKCVREYPTDPEQLQVWGNLSDENWDAFMHNETNWWVDGDGNYGMCGNATGAGKCPFGYICMAGFGPNPNYGYD